MGYYIRELKNKSQLPHWKIQFITYKKAETQNSNAQKPRKEWDVPTRRWNSLGFKDSMTLEQARCRAKQINAQIEIKRQESRRKKIEEDYEKLQTAFTAAMTEVFKEEFELKYITGRYQNPDWKRRFEVSWRAAQRMLIAVQLDPIDWHDDCRMFYDYLHNKKFSFSYIRKILLVTNLWGHFLSRRLGQSFMRIPIPNGVEKGRLLNAYFEKCGYRSNESEPILPARLQKAKPKLKPEHYNWIYLSVWLGLRPREVDQLKNEHFVRLQPGLHKKIILWIYQTKLSAVPPQYRWKLIPIIFSEQEVAIKILRSGTFKRPHVKLIKKYFGANRTLYAGRKGFTDLMLARQQDFINISQWMGHSSIERTWRNYKSKKIVHFTDIRNAS